jgi:hypothetical protein
MAWAGAAVVIRLLSQGILESGDGVLHYQIARYSWVHPHLLLDHWGKPLFTLFASPFAQLGHWGMVLFNALCFVVTCWAADGLLRRAGPLARWLFPAALMLVPVYGTMVLAGMTEVFFGMLTLLVVRALADRRFRLAAIIASFTPFARPEYVVFVPFVLLWLMWQRQWRALPLLLLGQAVYALAGAVALGDPLWFMHREPYTGASDIYGSGELLKFWERRKHIFGSPLIWTAVLSVMTGVLLWRNRLGERPMLNLLALLAWLPALGIVVLHSILWWKGLKGSLGLERVLATGIPLLVLAAVWAPARWSTTALAHKRSALLSVVFGLTYVLHAARVFPWESAMPVRRDTLQEFYDRVGDHLASLPTPEGRYVVLHPYIAYRAGLDPFDGEHFSQYWTGDDFAQGDRLVWDAHFGPNEARLPLHGLLSDSTMRSIGFFVPTEHLIMLGGNAMEVHLFERGPGRRWQREMTFLEHGHASHGILRQDLMPCGNGEACYGDHEFPFELAALPMEDPLMLFAELRITGELRWPNGEAGPLDLVFTEDATDGRLSYRAVSLEAGPFNVAFRVPLRPAGTTSKLYVWNQSGQPFALPDLRVSVVRTFQEPA